jgi:hypothetical protein
MPLVPVSWGELFDKITILEIKTERLPTAPARANAVRELALLRQVANGAAPSPALDGAVRQLSRVNRQLWEVEDAIRLCERDGNFGLGFVALARSVYQQNDERAALKRRISLLLSSALVEEKSYQGY